MLSPPLESGLLRVRLLSYLSCVFRPEK
jgi:hypothetical protein